MKNAEIRRRRAGRESPRLGTYEPGKPTPRRSKPVQRPGARAWHDHPTWGLCQGCGKRARLQAHHVLVESYVEHAAPERVFDLANRILLGVLCCHPDHHHPGCRDTRLEYEQVPKAAVAFAIEVIGAGPAIEFFRRRYRNAPNPTGGEACP